MGLDILSLNKRTVAGHYYHRAIVSILFTKGDPLSPLELFLIYLLTNIFKASTKPCLHLIMVQHRVGSPLDSMILGTALSDSASPTTAADIAAE